MKQNWEKQRQQNILNRSYFLLLINLLIMVGNNQVTFKMTNLYIYAHLSEHF